MTRDARVTRKGGVMDKIVLSNAHCKAAPGATYNALTEYDYSCRVNKVIKDVLAQKGFDVTIIDGGAGDQNQTLRNKVQQVNQIAPIAAIENHLNASDNPNASYGAEVLHCKGSTKGLALAGSLVKRFEYLPTKNKGATPRDDLYFLKATSCPAIITEPIFLSHQLEQKYLNFTRGIDVLGRLIAEGIADWAGAQ